MEQSNDILKNRLFDWFLNASDEERRLCEKVSAFEIEDLFADMMFRPGSTTHDAIACKWKVPNGEFVDGIVDLPDLLCYLSEDNFTYHVEELGAGVAGQFSGADFALTISPEHLDDDSVILHEMVHLHEFVINSLPLYFHDTLLWCLYKSLREKISDLDDRIKEHGHVFNSRAIEIEGGTHDILFLLKCFDLDLRKGYPLGTVFGYGMSLE